MAKANLPSALPRRRDLRAQPSKPRPLKFRVYLSPVSSTNWAGRPHRRRVWRWIGKSPLPTAAFPHPDRRTKFRGPCRCRASLAPGFSSARAVPSPSPGHQRGWRPDDASSADNVCRLRTWIHAGSPSVVYVGSPAATYIPYSESGDGCLKMIMVPVDIVDRREDLKIHSHLRALNQGSLY